MSNKTTVLKSIRKLAMKQTIGKRPHLYVPKLGTIKKYHGAMGTVPIQTYHFTLHPECTRAVYRMHKRTYLRSIAPSTTPIKRYITGFGSRARARGKEYGPDSRRSS
jgi:hypothetical protein